SDLKEINVQFAKERSQDDPAYLPYKRNEKFVREWAIPGTKGVEHRLGGLEKDKETGNVSYEPENHEYMVKVRAQKIAEIANHIPEQDLDNGTEKSKLLVLGWGSTYGSIKTVVKELATEGIDIAHAQIKYIQPMPRNLGDLLSKFDKILIPEMNNGQLITLIRDQYLVDAKPLNKIKGVPFEAREIKEAILNMLKN
ncbi:MAG: 2-oxoglutarate ferredoxin oxidoreductase subunit alpha, partial [Flavobacteriales bacterium]